MGTQAGEEHGQAAGPKPEHTAPQLVGPFFPMAKAEQSIWLQWMLATTLGGGVGWAVVWSWDGGKREAVYWAVGRAVFGFVVGVAQWFVLKQKFDRAGWWILASTMGWAVGGAVYWAVDKAAVSRAVVGAVVGAVSGAVGGTITGIVLIWLLRHPISKA